MSQVYQLSLKLRPNNQVTVTRGSFAKKSDRPFQDRWAHINDINPLKLDEKILKYKEFGGRERSMDKFFREAKKRRTHSKLDLIGKSQPSTAIEPRKQLRGFGETPLPRAFKSASGQKLRESGAALDTITEPRFCHCVTLTLPANHEAAYRVLSDYSGFIVNRLFQRIRREYKGQVHWFFVWEYQKRGALHLHIALYHPDESEGLMISAKMLDDWHNLLVELQDKTQVDMFCRGDHQSCTIRSNHQHHCQPMNKSLGAYFSKYAGKEHSKTDIQVKNFPVSRFWGSSYSLKKIVNELSFELKLDFISDDCSCNTFYQRILKIILEYEIVSLNQYSFHIETEKEYYQKGKQFKQKLVIADGEREVFYIKNSEYISILKEFAAL